MTDGAGIASESGGGVAAADGPEPAVRVVDLTMEFAGGVRALGGVTFDVPKGELVSIIGPSGCGKTTTLKIIAGLIEATSGRVEVAGAPVTKPGPDRAFVFQDFALMPWATVLRNAAFGLELRGVARTEREEAARAYVDKVGLSGFEDAYPHQLSGGMRQRVGLARALAVDADILLMDEPFASVDEQIRRKFQEDLLELLSGEGKTVIFVTHSIEEAVYVSDQIVILTRGPSRVSNVIRPGVDRSGGSDGRLELVSLLPPFTEVLAAFPEVVSSSTFAEAAWITLQAFLIGMALSLVIGIGVGILMGASRAIGSLMGMWVNIFESSPLTAVVPALMALLGFGLPTMIVTVFLFSVWVIALDTQVGVERVSPSLVEMGRSFGASKRVLYSQIVLRAALPELLAGIRLGLIRGLKGVVIGQLLIAVLGVGYLFELYSRNFLMPQFWALLIILFAFAFLASETVAHFERKVSFYASSR
jgi:NitT/TauT family transport system ATP-binding protein